MGEKLILIDGHSILNRAFYGVPDLTNAEGIHTNAMYGFLNILFKFLDEEKPDYITVAFDLSAPTFRHKAFDGYKGTRKPMQPELKQQVPLMKELLKAMNITVVEQEGYEADDILGTIAKESAAKGIDVSIVSGDRDLLQLADEHIKIRIPKTKKGVTEVEDYYPSDVFNLYGVTPHEFIDVSFSTLISSLSLPRAFLKVSVRVSEVFLNSSSSSLTSSLKVLFKSASMRKNFRPSFFCSRWPMNGLSMLWGRMTASRPSFLNMLMYWLCSFSSVT